MKPVVFRLLALVALALTSFSLVAENASPTPPPTPVVKSGVPSTIGVEDLHIGMRGVAYTVFEGVKPEAMEVEVLGVLRNAMGPKSNLILVRLHGAKVEYTGVVAGMSGSPVY